ncbi:MAG: pilin [Candidatus Moraniibacteriota bacterium]
MSISVKKLIPFLFIFILFYFGINVAPIHADTSCSDLEGSCIGESETCDGYAVSDTDCEEGHICCVPGESCSELGGSCTTDITGMTGCPSGETSVGVKNCDPVYEICCVPDEPENCSTLGGDCINESDDCEEGSVTTDTDCDDGKVCCVPDEEPPSPESEYCAEYQEGIGEGFMILEGHLVPCGRQCDDPNTANDETASCTLCHLFILMKNIFDLVLSLFIITSLLVITVGGVMYIVSAGSSGLKQKGKQTIQYALTAFAILLLSWLIVYTALNFLSANSDFIGNGDNWFEFDCDTDSSFESGLQEGEPDESDYTYQSGIESQTSDMSPELEAFLNNLKDNLPAEAKEISSISDSYGFDNCKGDSYDPNNCAHSENSCHYGGTSEECQEKGSYAVDFGNENYYNQIKEAAKSVEPDAYVLFESNHVHVSVGSVNGCGCN